MIKTVGTRLLALFVVAMLALPEIALAQAPSNFPTSLHALRKGKATFYSKDNGGFETLTNIPMTELACQKCHAPTYADGTPVDKATYAPDCKDCHDFSKGTSVADATCLGCHSRQATEINLGITDVHRDRGLSCMTCHTTREMHGDGTEYASMLEPGAMDASCDNDGCHPAATLPQNSAHAIHGNSVDCAACHAQSVSSCYNCHFETEVEVDQKRFYGPPPATGFVMLVNRPAKGKIVTASFQALSYQGQTFYTIAPFSGHTITDEPRGCGDCHGSASVMSYTQRGEIDVARWDETEKKLVFSKGILPVPPDWEDALKLDFVDYTGDVTDPTRPLDPAKWEYLKTGADLTQMLYAEPLTAEQMQKLSMVVAVDGEEGILPQSFKLAQNYPNPFNPLTHIAFEVPKATMVTLKVYNAVGNEVAVLVNQILPAGQHDAVFDAGAVPSGVYFYTLQAAGFSETKKMILLR